MTTKETRRGWVENQPAGWHLRQPDGSLVVLAVEDSGPDLALFLGEPAAVSGVMLSGIMMVEECEMLLEPLLLMLCRP